MIGNLKKLPLIFVLFLFDCSAGGIEEGGHWKKRKVESDQVAQARDVSPSGSIGETLPASKVVAHVFKGSAEEMGHQHGALLRMEISNVIEHWLKPIRNLIPFLVERFITVKSSSMVEHLPVEFQSEMRALAQAAELSEGEKTNSPWEPDAGFNGHGTEAFGLFNLCSHAGPKQNKGDDFRAQPRLRLL